MCSRVTGILDPLVGLVGEVRLGLKVQGESDDST